MSLGLLRMDTWNEIQRPSVVTLETCNVERAGRKRRAYQIPGAFFQVREERSGLVFVLGSKEGEFGIGKSGQCVGYFRINISMITEKCPFDVEVKKLSVTLIFKGLSVG